MRKVDKNSPIPLYYQLKNLISEMIENEELSAGDPIPPERELCEYHNVSRMTVNKAIASLANEGMVYREQGRGTFVKGPKEKHRLSHLRGFTEDMQDRGLSVQTKLLLFQRKEATRKVQQDLKLENGQEVFEIMRLRYVAEEPYALETAYLPVHLCPRLSSEMLAEHSLYDVLRQEFQLEMDYAFQTIEPALINDYESNMLQVPKNSLGLLFSRRTYLADHTPMEVTKAIYRSDRYKYEVTLRR